MGGRQGSYYSKYRSRSARDSNNRIHEPFVEHRMSILIIDPYLEELNTLKAELQSVGYEDVVSVESFTEALAFYRVDSLGNLPSDVDLVLMDLASASSESAGFGTAPRQSGSIGHPVLLGLVDEFDSTGIENAAAAGALDIIRRPVFKAELIMRVRSALTFKSEKSAKPKPEATQNAQTAGNTLKPEQVVSHNTEVLCLASHELKTPLASLSGFVDMILSDWERNGPPSEKQKRQLEASSGTVSAWTPWWTTSWRWRRSSRAP